MRNKIANNPPINKIIISRAAAGLRVRMTQGTQKAIRDLVNGEVDRVFFLMNATENYGLTSQEAQAVIDTINSAVL